MSAGVASCRSDRALLALVAVFVPARARSLLAGLGGSEGAELLAAGAELASLPRRDRLLALAAALGELHQSCASFPAPRVAAERPSTRELLSKGWSAGPDRGCNALRPALTRLLEEAALGAEEESRGAGRVDGTRAATPRCEPDAPIEPRGGSPSPGLGGRTAAGGPPCAPADGQ